jgi:hypothetical protein
MTKKPPKSARRHAEVENLSMFGTTTRIGPAFLLVYADHFLLAAKSTQAPATAPQFPLVRTFLVCRAVELALKAFLSLRGCSLVALAGGPYGHDLKSLIEVAEKQDFHALVKLDDRQRAEIIRASTYYLEKVLEYPALTEAVRAYPDLPDANVLIDAAEALVSALREPCLAA